MGSLAYPLSILKSHRGFTLFSIVVIVAFQYVIISLLTSIDTQAMLGTLMELLPERFRMIVSENFLTRLSVNGAAAFGFNHPFVLALLVISAINIPARHIAGDIESGMMEWLLAHPVTRMRLLVTVWLTGATQLFLIVCCAWAGSFSALWLNDALSSAIAGKMLQIGINLWLLTVVVMCFAMLFSVFGKEGSRAGTRAAGVVLVFYFLHFTGVLWDFIAVLKPLNIFTYYEPQKLMEGRRSFGLNAVVLTALIGISLTISVLWFRRRDIPG